MQRVTELFPQVFKFVLVGGINTAIHFAVYNALAFSFGITKGVGVGIFTAIAFIIASTNSYFFNKNWTFKDTTTDKEVVKFSTFFAVSFVGFMINVSVVYFVTTYIPEFFGIPGILSLLGGSTGFAWANFALLTAIFFSLLWNFVGYKFLVFKK